MEFDPTSDLIDLPDILLQELTFDDIYSNSGLSSSPRSRSPPQSRSYREETPLETRRKRWISDRVDNSLKEVLTNQMITKRIRRLQSLFRTYELSTVITQLSLDWSQFLNQRRRFQNLSQPKTRREYWININILKNNLNLIPSAALVFVSNLFWNIEREIDQPVCPTSCSWSLVLDR